MRSSALSAAIAAVAIVVTAAPAAAFDCYMIVDANNEVVYQDVTPPIDLSENGAAARDAIRVRSAQLIAMDTDRCPAIDRTLIAGRRGPASVEEIVAGMRSATPYGTAAGSSQQGAASTTTGNVALPRITVPRATGGGISPSGPPSGMSIR